MRTSNCGWRVIGGQFVERLKRDEVWMRGDDFHEFSKTGADDMVVGDPLRSLRREHPLHRAICHRTMIGQSSKE